MVKKQKTRDDQTSPRIAFVGISEYRGLFAKGTKLSYPSLKSGLGTFSKHCTESMPMTEVVKKSKPDACNTSTEEVNETPEETKETLIRTTTDMASTPKTIELAESTTTTLEQSSVCTAKNQGGAQTSNHIQSNKGSAVPLLDENGKPLSKNQQKKRKRYEKLMAIKKRRKEQEKEAKAAKAKAAGRYVRVDDWYSFLF